MGGSASLLREEIELFGMRSDIWIVDVEISDVPGHVPQVRVYEYPDEAPILVPRGPAMQYDIDTHRLSHEGQEQDAPESLRFLIAECVRDELGIGRG